MLRLMLFRHAEADRPVDLVDHERPLSIRGHHQARKMGEYIGAQKLAPDLVIISSARRTQETWMEASDAGKIVAAKVVEPRIYESSVDVLRNIISKQDPKHCSIMLVGHNPGMERLTAWLTDSNTGIAHAGQHQGFVVGGLAVIDIPIDTWTALEAQSGRLERFETPDTV